MAKKAIRPIRIEGNIAYISLTKGYEAVIDATDVPLVDGFNWYASIARKPDGSIRTVYACSEEKGPRGRRTHLLHRIIAKTPGDTETDHRDGDGLNNRRSNLRPASKAQNMHNMRISSANTSGYKGVSLDKHKVKWRANIMHEGRRLYLGVFRCQTAAAVAYAKASRELHGAYGRTG